MLRNGQIKNPMKAQFHEVKMKYYSYAELEFINEWLKFIGNRKWCKCPNCGKKVFEYDKECRNCKYTEEGNIYENVMASQKSQGE